jgi:hypothetical protein
MQQTILLLPPENEHQRSVNDFWQCIIENPEACTATLTHNRAITHLSWQNLVVTTSGLCPQNQRQWSINDFQSSMMENARAAWRHSTMIGLSANFQGKNDCDNVASMSSK